MHPWTKYAFGEGLTKITNGLFSKLMGITGGAPSVLWVSLAIASMQSLGGLTGALLRHERVVPSWRSVGGSLAFGASAFLMTILGLYAFTFEGADVGITTFITTFTVMFGVFIDRIFFGNRLILHQWFGIAIFFLAGYAMLNFPSLNYLIELPVWIVLYLVVSMLGGFNEGMTRAVSRISFPLSHNFWVGATTATLSFAGIALFGLWDGATLFTSKVWFVPFIMGFVTLTMISFKLLTYKNGGTIALAKMVMFGTNLIGAVLLGALFFGEPLTVGKFVGIAGFFLAFSLTDRETFQYIRQFFTKAKERPPYA
jgi:drug/metabolite transporter (DMT)-like permease